MYLYLFVMYTLKMPDQEHGSIHWRKVSARDVLDKEGIDEVIYKMKNEAYGEGADYIEPSVVCTFSTKKDLIKKILEYTEV